jgi:hypothetical protein
LPSDPNSPVANDWYLIPARRQASNKIDLNYLVASIPFPFCGPPIAHTKVTHPAVAVHDALVSVGGATARTPTDRHHVTPSQSIADTIVQWKRARIGTIDSRTATGPQGRSKLGR